MADYRVHSIVVAADRTAANTAAAVYWGGADNYSIELSADGSAPATDYGCSGQLDDLQWDAMRAANATLSELYWKCTQNPRSPILLETNCAASQSRVGFVCKWVNALDDAGLQTVS